LSAIHLVEYAAQAMAAHGALQSSGSAQPGMLASLRQIVLHVEQVHDIPGNLIVRADRLLARPEGSLYQFSVSGDGRVLCEGRVAIALG
jgi:predicted hotdog family 3-hydroxylacyl-ACP dehydratase